MRLMTLSMDRTSRAVNRLLSCWVGDGLMGASNTRVVSMLLSNHHNQSRAATTSWPVMAAYVAAALA